MDYHSSLFRSNKALLLTLSGLFLSSSVLADVDHKEMVFIQGDTFEMGCDSAIDPICSSVPAEHKHKVEISSFYMDKYEVTTARYRECVNAGNCTLPTMGGLMHYDDEGTENFPINGVNWNQAVAFCAAEGKRLPTSAEWEFAARGTDGRIYPWGNEEPTCDLAIKDKPNAGFLGCGTGNSKDVGSVPDGASPFGVMDMAGNVWEWTSDWFDEEYYFNSPEKDPQGPAIGELKITRGGDFLGRQGYEFRSTGRFPYYPTNPSPAIGFRCVKDV